MNLKSLIYLLPFIIFSCSTPENITYFQDLQNVSQADLDSMYLQYSAKIFPDDLLGITVSAQNTAAVAAYNLPAVSFMSPSTLTNNNTERRDPSLTNTALQPYLVDEEGNIDFPVLGKVKVGGLTKIEATKLLESMISRDVKDPIVTIQNLNFKISVLGEVDRPGSFILNNERISILDAISLAGDLTIQGEREKVLLIRDNNGKKEFHYFDLTSPDTFKSPYFYLQQNDIVYVEPNKARKKTANYSQTDQYFITVTSTVLTAVSIITTLIVNLNK